MRVWTKTVLAWDPELQTYITDEAASEFYEYDGPVAEAKGGGSDKEAKRARKAEEARQARIKLGIQQIKDIFEGANGFDNAFFEKRRKAYLDYAMPQLEDQYADQNKNLIFALARGGNLESSLSAERKAKLLAERDRNIIDVGGQAQNFVNATRQDIENSRNDLVNQLTATGDNELAAANAMRASGNLRIMPGFSPIGQLFNDAAAGIGAYAGGRQYGSIQNQIRQYDNSVRSPFGKGSMTTGK